MGIEVNHYETPAEEFSELKGKFPTGRYDENNGTRWFAVYIKEMNLEITWFNERKSMRPDLHED